MAYTEKIKDLLDPFFEAASLAKQLGNISFRKIKYDLKTLCKILEDDIMEIIDAEIVSHPQKQRSEELQIVLAEIRDIINSSS